MMVEVLKSWGPSIISIIVLFINILYYIFGQPRVSFKAKRKEQLVNISEEFLIFLFEVVSYSDFNGVPTKVRNFSLKIHLCFKEGTAPDQLAQMLEDLFQQVRLRKKITSQQDIDKWNEQFRCKVRELRKELAKYCGVLK